MAQICRKHSAAKLGVEADHNYDFSTQFSLSLWQLVWWLHVTIIIFLYGHIW